MDVAAFAPGYIDLLRSKDRGMGVRQAADYLQPVVDIGRLLEVDRITTAFVSFPGAVNNGNNDFDNIFTVPQGETWRLISYGFIITELVALGDAVVNHVLLHRPPGADPSFGSSFHLHQFPDVNSLLVPEVWSGWMPPADLWLAQGSTFGSFFSVTGATLGANFSAHCSYVKLRS